MLNQTTQSLFQLPEVATFAMSSKSAPAITKQALPYLPKAGSRVTTMQATLSTRDGYDQKNTVQPQNQSTSQPAPPNMENLISSDKLTKAFDIRKEQAAAKNTSDGVVKSSL